MKQTIANLVDGLCRRCQIAPEAASPFVLEFFNQIVAGLENDQIVKVRGLGTFKLLNVEERASMNVNSGERIVIPEHYKMTFTPDPVMRDEVNKPFADFESVELNDDTPIEAMMNGNDNGELTSSSQVNQNEQDCVFRVSSDDARIEDQYDIENKMTQTNEPENAMTDNVIAENPMEEPVADPALDETQQEAGTSSEKLVAWGALEGDVGVEDTSTDHIHQPRSYCLVVLCTILALLAGYVLGSFYPLKDVIAFMDKRPLEYIGETRITPSIVDADSLEVEQTVTTTGTPTGQTSVSQPKTKQEAAKPQEQAAKPKAQTKAESPDGWPQVEGGEFWIVGEIGKDTMKVGRNLLRISRRHYGSDKYVPYICVMNNITNPDIVPLNKELRLPKLRKKE